MRALALGLLLYGIIGTFFFYFCVPRVWTRKYNWTAVVVALPGCPFNSDGDFSNQNQSVLGLGVRDTPTRWGRIQEAPGSGVDARLL